MVENTMKKNRGSAGGIADLSEPPVGNALPEEAFNPSLMNRAERRRFQKFNKVKVVAMNKPIVKSK